MYVAQSQLKTLDPVVESISPAHDSSSVPTNSAIILAFSTAMDPATTERPSPRHPRRPAVRMVLRKHDAHLHARLHRGKTLHTVRLGGERRYRNWRADVGIVRVPFLPRRLLRVHRRRAVAFSSGWATSDTTATLGASVNPNGNATTVSFQYGPTSAYGLSSPGQNIGGGNSAIAVSADLTGLAHGEELSFPHRGDECPGDHLRTGRHPRHHDRDSRDHRHHGSGHLHHCKFRESERHGQPEWRPHIGEFHLWPPAECSLPCHAGAGCRKRRQQSRFLRSARRTRPRNDLLLRHPGHRRIQNDPGKRDGCSPPLPSYHPSPPTPRRA